MKILHISSPGYRTAGKLAFDIHDKFLKEGHDSFIVSKGLNTKVKSSYSYNNVFINWIERRFQSILFHYNNIVKRKKYIDNRFNFLDLKENRNQYRYKNILKKIDALFFLDFFY